MRRVRRRPYSGAIVPLRAEGSRNPLFLLHGVDGDILEFEKLARNLDAGRPVYGIRSQVLVGERHALTRLEDMAAYYLAELRRVQECGPYCLLGYSFGCLVAFEIANQLWAQGEQVGMLAMVDNRRILPYGILKVRAGRPGQPSLSALSTHLGAEHPVGSASLGFNSRLKRLFAPGGLAYVGTRLRAHSLMIIYTVLDAFGKPIPHFLQRAWDINWFAAVRYVPAPYPGRLVLFQTEEAMRDVGSRTGGWEDLAGAGVEVREIAGGHGDVLDEPLVLSFAEQLTACLEAAAHGL